MEEAREENQEPQPGNNEQPAAHSVSHVKGSSDDPDSSPLSTVGGDPNATSSNSAAPSQPPPPPTPQTAPVGPATTTSQPTTTAATSQAPETTVAPAESTTATDKERKDQQQAELEPEGLVKSGLNLFAVNQMEAYLLAQIERCKFYKSYFEGQGNPTMAAKFDTYTILTSDDLELLRKLARSSEEMPKFKFEEVQLLCVPTNIDIKEKELHISVQTSGLEVPEDSMTYIVAEFEFPVTKTESHGEMMGRWLHSVKIEPKKLICCSGTSDKQLDIIYSTDVKPFYKPGSESTEYDRSLQFFIDKGRSRTLKRKYKPVKLTFYEKTGFLRFDRRLGTVQVRVDGINEESTIVTKLPIMNGRKLTQGLAEITVRVREPLVEKTLRAHREKLLVLT